jgi:hypothetical protein
MARIYPNKLHVNDYNLTFGEIAHRIQWINAIILFENNLYLRRFSQKIINFY